MNRALKRTGAVIEGQRYGDILAAPEIVNKLRLSVFWAFQTKTVTLEHSTKPRGETMDVCVSGSQLRRRQVEQIMPTGTPFDLVLGAGLETFQLTGGTWPPETKAGAPARNTCAQELCSRLESFHRSSQLSDDVAARWSFCQFDGGPGYLLLHLPCVQDQKTATALGNIPSHCIDAESVGVLETRDGIQIVRMSLAAGISQKQQRKLAKLLVTLARSLSRSGAYSCFNVSGRGDVSAMMHTCTDVDLISLQATFPGFAVQKTQSSRKLVLRFPTPDGERQVLHPMVSSAVHYRLGGYHLRRSLSLPPSVPIALPPLAVALPCAQHHGNVTRQYFVLITYFLLLAIRRHRSKGTFRWVHGC